MIDTSLNINGVIGSVIEVDKCDRALVEREFGEGMLLMPNISSRGEPRGGNYMVENPVDGSMRFPDVPWFEDMRRQGRIRLIRDGFGPLAAKPEIVDDLDHEEIARKDPMAIARRTLVRELAERGIATHDPDLSGHVSGIWAEKKLAQYGRKPAPSTVRDWLKRGDPLEVTLRQMMSNTGRVERAKRLDPEVVQMLLDRARWFYDQRRRRQIDVRAQIHKDVDDRNVERAELGLPSLKVPSKETVRRYVEGALNRDTFVQKWGEQAAKAKWDGAGKGLVAPKILAIGLIDDTVLDCVTVFDVDRNIPAGRPWLCVLLDVYSRCVLGWTLSYVPPTIHTAAECIRRANRPKLVRPDRAERYPALTKIGGKCSTILSDHGVNYASPSFQEILADLGITYKLAAIGSPTHKAMIERFFLTLKTWLIDKLLGATLDPKLLREFDIDPEKEAVFTLAELELLIEEFVFVYHISVHSGLGCQPLAKWAASMIAHGRDIIADESKLEVLTGVTLRGRRFYRGAIRMLGLTYRDGEVSARLNANLVAAEPHRARNAGGVVATVDIKYDPADLARILVRDRVAKEWVALPCTDQTYASGLSLWQHRQIRAWTTKRNIAFNTEDERLEARRQLNELILELAPDMPARERRAVARMVGDAPGAGLPKVALAEAEPRHDGLGAVIEHDTAEDRLDGDRRPSRPARKGKGKGRGRGRSTQARQVEDDLLEEDLREDASDEAFWEPKAPLEAAADDDERFEEMA